ncbi:hypothetical protein [Rubritalea tangerina]|uniref:hypothetical protein n=1 Tax=Rubritalea tangerina TaxID=430798 RepID=UPI00360B29D5
MANAIESFFFIVVLFFIGVSISRVNTTLAPKGHANLQPSLYKDLNPHSPYTDSNHNIHIIHILRKRSEFYSCGLHIYPC